MRDRESLTILPKPFVLWTVSCHKQSSDIYQSKQIHHDPDAISITFYQMIKLLTSQLTWFCHQFPNKPYSFNAKNCERVSFFSSTGVFVWNGVHGDARVDPDWWGWQQ